MQISVDIRSMPYCPNTRFAVVVDGVMVDHFGSRLEAYRHMDVLWDARSNGDKRMEQFYTGR